MPLSSTLVLTSLILAQRISLVSASQVVLPTPVICEDTIDGSKPFDSNNVPCILGCGAPIAIATGGLLPGSVNETDIPYCQLNCVHRPANAAQSSAAPSCHEQCKDGNSGTPENIGWCMFWCVEGYGDVVPKTTCVPSLKFGDPEPTVIDGSTVTVAPLIMPSAWRSWYKTQTVLSRPAEAARTAVPSTVGSTEKPIIPLTVGSTRESTAHPSTTAAPSASLVPPAKADEQKKTADNAGGHGIVVPSCVVLISGSLLLVVSFLI